MSEPLSDGLPAERLPREVRPVVERACPRRRPARTIGPREPRPNEQSTRTTNERRPTNQEQDQQSKNQKQDRTQKQSVRHNGINDPWRATSRQAFSFEMVSSGSGTDCFRSPERASPARVDYSRVTEGDAVPDGAIDRVGWVIGLLGLPRASAGARFRLVLSSLTLVVCVSICLILSACSGSSHAGRPRSAPTTALPRPAPLSVQTPIRRAWMAAFDVALAPAVRGRYVEDGSRYGRWFATQSRSPAWRGTSVVVASVAVIDATHATVSYRLVRGGRTLVSAGGAAIRIGSSWVVAKSTLCALSILRKDRAPGC